MKNCGKLLLLLSSFPLQVSMNHMFSIGNMTSLRTCYLIFGMVAFLVHIKFHICLAQMWHVSNNFHFSCMLFKHAKFQIENDILPLHSQTQNALCTTNFSIITFEHFFPHELYSPNFFTFAKGIVIAFRIF